MIFCTQLTFDLFLRLRSNYRLGIHPYVFCHISRNNISMGRIMYSILPSKVKISVFFSMGLPTIININEFNPIYKRRDKVTRKVVQDDQDKKMGRDVLFGMKCPGTIRWKYPNTPCCMKAYMSHKIHHVFNFADVNKNLYVNLCDKKQISDWKWNCNIRIVFKQIIVV